MENFSVTCPECIRYKINNGSPRIVPWGTPRRFEPVSASKRCLKSKCFESKRALKLSGMNSVAI